MGPISYSYKLSLVIEKTKCCEYGPRFVDGHLHYWHFYYVIESQSVSDCNILISGARLWPCITLADPYNTKYKTRVAVFGCEKYTRLFYHIKSCLVEALV